MARWRWAGVAAAVLGLAGCGGGDLASPTGATSASALLGPTWRLTSINGQAVVAGTSVTAEFASEERVSGRAGCNLYFGSARAEDGGRLAVGPLASTMMACAPQSVMDQETQYLATLQAATSYSVSGGELRLGPSAAGTTLVFTSR